MEFYLARACRGPFRSLCRVVPGVPVDAPLGARSTRPAKAAVESRSSTPRERPHRFGQCRRTACPPRPCEDQTPNIGRRSRGRRMGCLESGHDRFRRLGQTGHARPGSSVSAPATPSASRAKRLERTTRTRRPCGERARRLAAAATAMPARGSSRAARGRVSLPRRRARP